MAERQGFGNCAPSAGALFRFQRLNHSWRAWRGRRTASAKMGRSTNLRQIHVERVNVRIAANHRADRRVAGSQATEHIPSHIRLEELPRTQHALDSSIADSHPEYSLLGCIRLLIVDVFAVTGPKGRTQPNASCQRRPLPRAEVE